MTMAVAPLMQMAMDPKVQKSAKSVIKYLLIFGGVGVAILLFVFMGKGFNPFKKIGDWFKRKFSGAGIAGSIGKSIGSAFGLGKIGGIGEKLTGAVQSTAILTKTPMEERRLFLRLSKGASRKMGVIAKNKKIDLAIRQRASVIKTSFRRVQKKKTKDITKRFAGAFNRKKSKKKKKKKKGWF